jgi:hypothetical protein
MGRVVARAFSRKRVVSIILRNVACVAAFLSLAYPVLVNGATPDRVRGVEMPGFARLIFSFSALPVVETTQANGVLVLHFDRPISLDPAHLPLEIPSAVSGARLDPDHLALRLALSKSIKPNMIEAGNDLYVDLLPLNWKGAPPSLPFDVIQTLSNKARQADAIKDQQTSSAVRTLFVDSASTGKLSRLILRGVDPSDVMIDKSPQRVELSLSGSWNFDAARLRAELPRGFASVDYIFKDNHTVITFVSTSKALLDTHIDDGHVVVDVTSRVLGATEPLDHGPEIVTGTIDPQAPTNRPVTPRVSIAEDGSGPLVTLEGLDIVPKAVFVRGNFLWVVLDLKSTPDIRSDSAKASMPLLSGQTGGRQGTAFFLRVPLQSPAKPIMGRDGGVTTIRLSSSVPASSDGIALTSVPLPNGRFQISAAVKEVGNIVELDDPDSLDHIIVVLTTQPGFGTGEARTFPEFAVLPSAQGLVISPIVDDLEVTSITGQVVIQREGGLYAGEVETGAGPGRVIGSVINRARWDLNRDDVTLERLDSERDEIAQVGPGLKREKQLDLARHLAALGYYREAASTYFSAFDNNLESIADPRAKIELGIYEVLAWNSRFAEAILNVQQLTDNEEALLWRGCLAARGGRFSEAVAAYRRSPHMLVTYPVEVQRSLALCLAEGALEAGDVVAAGDLSTIAPKGATLAELAMAEYVKARLEEIAGGLEKARGSYQRLAMAEDRGIATRAQAALIALDLRTEKMTPKAALDGYNSLALFWRGDFLEAKLLSASAHVALDMKEWHAAFLAVQRLNRLYADTDGVRPLLDEMTARFASLLALDTKEPLDPIDAVTLFAEFREFLPVGKRADDLIRAYIERLVDLDLLPQATELLRYQIDYRLDGNNRGEAAVRLASLYLLDHKPIEAVRAIADTRSGAYPDDLRIARRLMEARARSDLGESKAAVELLEGLQGTEASIIRADAYWKQKDWDNAGASYEVALGDAWRSGRALQALEQRVLLKASVAFVMAGDMMAADRLRGRYMSKILAAPESGAFRLMTAPSQVRGSFASTLSAQSNDADLLDAFLKSYHGIFGTGAAQDRGVQSAAG